jgi:hypothetical protein
MAAALEIEGCCNRGGSEVMRAVRKQEAEAMRGNGVCGLGW